MASRKAEKERRFRRKEQERKHFDGPMRQFIKQKYPLIFEEYKSFYEALTQRHPDARDLTKTHTYKAWAASLKQKDSSDILATALRQALGQEESSNHDQNGESSCGQTSNHDQNGESSCGQTSNHDQNGESLTFTLTDKELERETGEATNVLIDLNDMVDIMETVDAQVDSIMAELAADQDLAAILNRPVDVEEPAEADEGIELNPDDDIDIDLDVQPFDYDLEVETYDW